MLGHGKRAFGWVLTVYSALLSVITKILLGEDLGAW
jgi:hypothetical protein